jgi:Flp pilus assembly protein TadD
MPTTDELYDQAITTQQKGDLDGAIAQLQSLLEQDANHALGHAALSVFFSKQEKYDEAIQHGQRVCDLEPEDPFSFVALSLICQKAGRIMEAEQALMMARQAQAAGRFER